MVSLINIAASSRQGLDLGPRANRIRVEPIHGLIEWGSSPWLGAQGGSSQRNDQSRGDGENRSRH